MLEGQRRGVAPHRNAAAELSNQVVELERLLAATARELAEARQRADLAEHSAREAWAFARTILRTDRTSHP